VCKRRSVTGHALDRLMAMRRRDLVGTEEWCRAGCRESNVIGGVARTTCAHLF